MQHLQICIERGRVGRRAGNNFASLGKSDDDVVNVDTPEGIGTAARVLVYHAGTERVAG
ncbi:MAG: hypothetical protein KDA55_22450 [Planctomycetales bacterium]|nr:hypothetical protein [Planctomycetales bacterium]MCA9211144.1 hypothetical protein [Planctomycetales bacterium]